MHVLVLGPALYDTSPGQRFRIEQWARLLEKDGFHFTFVPFEDESLHRILYQPGRVAAKVGGMLRAMLRRYRLLFKIKKFDLIYLFRESTLLGPAFFERLIRMTGKPMVFDFDDAIWVPYASPANKYLSYLKCFGKTATLCRISSQVLAGNAYLAAYAHQHNKHVSTIPTTIDTDDYIPRPFAPDGEKLITIGWTGSYSTVQHLDILRPALAKLATRHRFRLMVIGTPNYDLPSVEVIAKQWQAKSEVHDLQQFDIGVMPLPDDDWSKGKCGLKLLQYMGVGLPVVGSPVGVNSVIIKDGQNGYLAASDTEWVERLSTLIEDANLRRQMGTNGRKTVEEGYSATVWAPIVGAIFSAVKEGRLPDTSTSGDSLGQIRKSYVK